KRGEAEQPIHLGGLSEDEGIELLIKEAREKDALPVLQAGDSLNRRVVRECDNLPLAIKTVVGWIKKGMGIKAALDGFMSVKGEGIHAFCFEESYELLKDHERLAAFTLAQQDGPVSRQELHGATELQLAALDGALESLTNLSIVELTPVGEEDVVGTM